MNVLWINSPKDNILLILEFSVTAAQKTVIKIIKIIYIMKSEILCRENGLNNSEMLH